MSKNRKNLRLGTRGSPLALAQSRWVAAELRRVHPDLEVEEVVVSTRGDRVLDVPLARIGGKGLFVKEIEDKLLAGEIDLAVHSMKDVPATLPEGLTIDCIPVRADPRDALCGKHASLEALPGKARVGTASVRRRAQLRRLRPDLVIEPVRGNVGTRLSRVDEGLFDGVILACAGLERLGLAGKIRRPIAAHVMIPAVGQGALAIEVRKGDATAGELLAAIDHAETHTTVGAERGFLERLEGSCQTPLAAHARIESGKLLIHGLLCDLTGEEMIKRSVEGDPAEAEALGRALAEEILREGGERILALLERQVAEEEQIPGARVPGAHPPGADE